MSIDSLNVFERYLLKSAYQSKRGIQPPARETTDLRKAFRFLRYHGLLWRYDIRRGDDAYFASPKAIEMLRRVGE